MKRIAVIDAQGGGIGKQIITEIRKRALDVEIIALGANSIATGQMVKAGADHGATGENPVRVMCPQMDVIIGPVGIAIADSMFGEITGDMAAAVGGSRAKKILIPVNMCSIHVVGIEDLNLKRLISEAVDVLQSEL